VIICTSFNSQYSRSTWANRYQNVRPFWILMQQMMTEVAMVQTRTQTHAKQLQ